MAVLYHITDIMWCADSRSGMRLKKKGEYEMRRKGKRALALFLTLVVITTMTLGGAMATSAENLNPADLSQSEIGETAADEQAETKGEMSDTAPAGETVPATEQTTETQEATDASTETPVTEAPVTEAAENGTETGTETPTEAQPTTETPSPSSEAASEVTTETATEAATEGLTEQESAADEAVSEKETQKESLVQQTVKASGSGASAVTLSGMMPEGASAKAVPVNVEIEGQTVLAAYDITIYDRDGKEFQPEQGSIRVEIVDAAVQEAVAQAEDISVFHMENVQAAPEAVANEKVDAAGSTVAFEAEHFSIYVVTTPEAHFTHTYKFYNGNNLVSEQILSTGETLQRPASPDAGDHQVFTGWYTAAEGGTAFTTFEPESTLTENKTTNLYAQFRTAYYVYYMSGSDADSRVLYTQSYYTTGATIVTENVPFSTDSDKALIGWSTRKGAETPDTGLTIGTEDMTLYPVVASAHWITYNSNGGTPVDPSYVLTNGVTKAPDDPEKTGYAFTGWYTDEDCKTKFSFGNGLAENIILYAGWETAQANYTVIFWQQRVTDNKNAADADKKYDYVTSEVREDRYTGQTASATYEDKNMSYTGFEFNSTKTKDVTVAADGSTILNVYYDRVLITYNFYSESYYNWTLETSMTGLYGSTLSANGYKWPSNQSYVWKYNESSTMTFLDEFYYVNSGERTTNFYKDSISTINLTYRHFTENLDGSWSEKNVAYSYIAVNQHKNFTFSDKYPGFTVKYYGLNNSTVKNNLPSTKSISVSRNDTLYVYHERNKYVLDYISGGKTIKSCSGNEAIPYETPLTDYGEYEPTERPNGVPQYYIFQGWYADPECTQKFDFENTIMPANVLAVYAKWAPEPVTVTFDLNGAVATDGDTRWDAQTIIPGNTVEKPDDPIRAGYVFAGWIRQGEPFHFDTQITENTVLVAQWISNEEHTLTYKAGTGATGNDVTDTLKYAEGAKAKVSSILDDWGWTAPEGSTGFLYWIDMDGNVYYPENTHYPGDVITFGSSDIVLTAIWADSRSTALTYNFNGGTYDNSEELRVTIDTPNSEYAIEDYEPTKEGHKFLGWTLASDGSGELLKAGDMIQVDTLNPATNVLYAKWAQVYTVTVRKIVSGNMGDTVSDTAYSFDYSVKESGVETADGTLSIKHNNSATIANIVSGSEVTITETGTNEAGYKTYVQVNNDDQVEKSSETIIVTGDTTVTFYNEKNIVPPTGLANRVLPAVVMTLLALAGAVYLFIAARRRRNAW